MSKEEKDIDLSNNTNPEPVAEEIPEKVKEEINKLKEKLQDFKKNLIKKFPFISAICLLPPQGIKIIEEDMAEDEKELLEKEKAKEKNKIMHIEIIIPYENEKQINEIKIESIKFTEKIKPKIWVHINTTKEIWDLGFDAKYDVLEIISMSMPLHDAGILGALRVTNVHKSMVLKKFERYIVSYVIAGSLVRGEAKKTSDVDIFVVVDDTDVRRMSRYELKEKLRHIILSYAAQAGEIADVKNKLNIQVYILTEFWESVKDAHPVIFTFIRDGVPLYDRGAFMPWKLLLKMGKIKPSPEAIDMFMSLGEKVSQDVQKKFNEIASSDIYWSIITPSQAALMLYGVAPPTPKETINLMKEIFVDKEKLLEKKYVDILNKIVTIYKSYEHEENKTITGKEIDDLLKDSSEYMARLKKLMDEIEKKARNKIILEVYDGVIDLLEKVFGKHSESELVSSLDKQLVRKGLIPQRSLILLNEIIDANNQLKKKKLEKHELERIRKNSFELVSALNEYIHRREMLTAEKYQIKIIYKINNELKEGKFFIFDDFAIIISDSDVAKKIDLKNYHINDMLVSDFNAKDYARTSPKLKISPELYTALGKLFGKFELVF